MGEPTCEAVLDAGGGAPKDTRDGDTSTDGGLKDGPQASIPGVEGCQPYTPLEYQSLVGNLPEDLARAADQIYVGNRCGQVFIAPSSTQANDAKCYRKDGSPIKVESTAEFDGTLILLKTGGIRSLKGDLLVNMMKDECGRFPDQEIAAGVAEIKFSGNKETAIAQIRIERACKDESCPNLTKVNVYTGEVTVKIQGRAVHKKNYKLEEQQQIWLNEQGEIVNSYDFRTREMLAIDPRSQTPGNCTVVPQQATLDGFIQFMIATVGVYLVRKYTQQRGKYAMAGRPSRKGK